MGRLADAFEHVNPATYPRKRRNRSYTPLRVVGTTIECPDCDGTGDIDWNGQVIPCPPCDGTGEIPETDLL